MSEVWVNSGVVLSLVVPASVVSWLVVVPASVVVPATVESEVKVNSGVTAVVGTSKVEAGAWGMVASLY